MSSALITCFGGSGDATKADLLREVQNLAVEEEISMITHESNHEGTILDWLLNAKENEIIVLCWVGTSAACFFFLNT